jgi:hypothetical protein
MKQAGRGSTKIREFKVSGKLSLRLDTRMG